MLFPQMGLSVLVLLMAVLVGCAGDGEGLDANGQPVTENNMGGDAPPEATFAWIQDNVFTPICTRCHSGANAPLGLQLDADHSYSLLVGINSVEDNALLRVAVTDPDNSYLVRKLEGTGVGGQMPLNGPYLSQDIINVIRQWITDGAQASVAANNVVDTPQALTLASSFPNDRLAVVTPPAQIVLQFSSELDATLLHEGNIWLQQISTQAADNLSASVRVPISLQLAAGNATTVILTPRSALTAGTYTVTLQGGTAGALADVHAVGLKQTTTLTFIVSPQLESLQ